MGATKEVVTGKLARFVVETSYDTIPAEAIRVAKERILDTVGVTLAGARDPDNAGIKVVELAREMGGNPISSVLGGGFKTNSINAAFANGTSAYALDFTDNTPYPLCNLSPCLVPAILAAAEESGSSGKDVLAAYVLGYEAAVRVGACMTGAPYFKRGFHSVGSWSCFGTTAASARLLNLTTEHLRSAWGIVASAAGTIRKNYGTQTRNLHAGYSARNGVTAAKLAKMGFSGDKSVLEKDQNARPGNHKCFSFPVVFAGEGEFEESKITDELGRRYDLVVRPLRERFHPGVGHEFIDLTLKLAKEHSISPDMVESVDLQCTETFMLITSAFADPQEPEAARHSIWYQVAVALLDGEVGFKQHSLKSLRRTDVREMMKRVKINEVSGWHAGITQSGDIARSGAARMSIKLKNGREISGELEKAKGDPSLPLAKEDLLEKYRTCSREAMSDADVEKTIELIYKLDEISDLTELMGLLRGKP